MYEKVCVCVCVCVWEVCVIGELNYVYVCVVCVCLWREDGVCVSVTYVCVCLSCASISGGRMGLVCQ